MVEQYQDIFSDVPSVTNLLKHKIVLNSSVPVRAKPYTVPLHLIKQLDQELDSMLEAGIIEPSQSFYASPIVLIKKPNGDLRVCVSYKNLNKISLFDPEPAVNADDIFDKLGVHDFTPSSIFQRAFIRSLWRRSLGITPP